MREIKNNGFWFYWLKKPGTDFFSIELTGRAFENWYLTDNGKSVVKRRRKATGPHGRWRPGCQSWEK